MEDMNMMNVLLTVPVNTVYIICDVEFVDDTGQRKARGIYHPENLHRAYSWFRFCEDGYYADHECSDDVDRYPIIFGLPDTTYKATVRFGRGSFRDAAAETDSGWVWDDLVRELTIGDIKQMRKDFLKYIPDGDDYGVYVLTDKGREELEA